MKFFLLSFLFIFNIFANSKPTAITNMSKAARSVYYDIDETKDKAALTLKNGKKKATKAVKDATNENIGEKKDKKKKLAKSTDNGSEDEKDVSDEATEELSLEDQMENSLNSMNKKENDETEPKNTLYIELKDCIVIAELWPKIAPAHVNRIRNLTKDGFYNDVPFHRVIPGFMAQTGDPTGTGTGGSGKKLNAEFNSEKHIRGILSMARAADVNSADSQFFIVTGKSFPQLDGQYTVFGKVLEGMQCVDKIKAGSSANNGMVDNPDKLVMALTGDMLNNKPLNIVKQEIDIINQVQEEKLKTDPKYEQKSTLLVLYNMRNTDITGQTDEEKIKKKAEETEKAKQEQMSAPIVIDNENENVE